MITRGANHCERTDDAACCQSPRSLRDDDPREIGEADEGGKRKGNRFSHFRVEAPCADSNDCGVF